MRKSSAGAALALVLLTTAPAAAQSRREMQMMADIRMLQEQTQQLQQQMQSAITTLTDTLKTINGRLDDQSNATRKAFADQQLVVGELGNNLRVIRERVDDTNVRIGSLSQEVEALRLSIPQFPVASPQTIDPGQQAPMPTPGQPFEPSSEPVPTPVGPGVTPQRMFATSWADYTAGQYESCIGGFEMYLRTFPRSEQAADAQFYIGECLYSSGKFVEAVDAYARVIANYPRSNKAPDAAYKRGVNFERLKQYDRARDSFEEVMKNYPDSEPARLAKQGLARLPRGRD